MFKNEAAVSFVCFKRLPGLFLNNGLQVCLAVQAFLGLGLDKLGTIRAFFFKVGLEDVTDNHAAFLGQGCIFEGMISDGVNAGKILQLSQAGGCLLSVGKVC
jgi:hypothetical protein